MKTYPFSALLGRMKYITRWSLMRSGRAESLSEQAQRLSHTVGQFRLSAAGAGGARTLPALTAS